MIGAAAAGADARKHDDLNFVARQERVTQHHRQLALPEWHVLALRSLALLRVDGAHTLLQAE